MIDREESEAWKRQRAEYDGEEPKQATPAQLVAEIAARLIQWRDMTGGDQSSTVSRWIHSLVALYKGDPRAMWLYLAWQTGDHSAIAESFEDRGRKTALPRQAVQQGAAQAMAVIARVRPELAAAMHEVRAALSPEAEGVPRDTDHKLAAVA